MTKRKYVPLLLTGFVTLIYFSCLFLWHTPLFAINDDMMIESIFSGSFFEPYAYSYYMSAQLGWILSACYRLLPGVPWLGLFYCSGNLFCFGVIQWDIFSEKGDDIRKKIGLSLGAILVFTALCLRFFLLFHYTYLAALFGATGLYLFLRRGREKGYLLPACMLLLSYLIRENVFFMLCPFLLASALFLVVEDHGKSLKKDLLSGLLFSAAFLALFLVNRLSLNGEAWKDYLRYNTVRTTVYDYQGVPADERAMEYYQSHGLTNEEVTLLQAYDLSLLPGEDSGYEELLTIADYGRERRNEEKSGLWQLVKIYLHRFLLQREDRPWNLIVILLYGVIFLACIVGKRFPELFPLVALGSFRSILWMVLLQKGRYPERVTLSLYLLEMAVLLGVLLAATNQISKKGKKLARTKLFLWILLAAIFAGAGIQTIRLTSAEYERNTAVNREDDLLYAYMGEHPDCFYYLEVYSVVYRTKEAFSGSEDRENYLWMGGWMIRHPLYLKKIRALMPGTDLVREILLSRENTYLVVKEGVGLSADQISDALGVTMKRVDQVEGNAVRFLIYQMLLD